MYLCTYLQCSMSSWYCFRGKGSELRLFFYFGRERRTSGAAVVIISLVQLLKAKYFFDLGLPEFRDSEAQH